LGSLFFTNSDSYSKMDIEVKWQRPGRAVADPFKLPASVADDASSVEAGIRSELGLGPFVPLSINKTTECVKVVVGRDPAPTLPTSIANRLSVAQDELRSLHLEISQLKGASRVQATVTTKLAPAAPYRNPLAPKSAAVSQISRSPPMFGMIPDVPLFQYVGGKSAQLSSLVAGKMAILGRHLWPFLR
jgi:hypothetical protein